MHTREKVRSEFENGAQADHDNTELAKETAREEDQCHHLHLASLLFAPLQFPSVPPLRSRFNSSRRIELETATPTE